MPDAASAAGAPASGAQNAPDAAPGTPEPPAPAGAEGGADAEARSREAANYRTRLRETEAERDALQARVDGQDRAAVERLVADRLHDPDDLLAAVDLDELRGDDGGLDEAKLDAAIGALVAAKPHYAIVRKAPDFDAGVRAGAPRQPSFGQALKDAARSGT